MKEKIIKLLKSENIDDRKVGIELLKEYHPHEFKEEGKVVIFSPRDLNRILETKEFFDENWNGNFHGLLLVFTDNWNMA